MLKCSFSKQSLMNAIGIVSKAVPVRTTMPVLECILLDASQNNIRLMANDMEMGIETAVEGMIYENGRIALDARLFSEITRRLPDSDVMIEADDDYHVTITSEKAVFHISGVNGDEFPGLPEISRKKYVVLSQLALKEMILQTIFSIAPGDGNKIMNGELMEVKNNVFSMTSLDGHRISIRKKPLNDTYEDVKVIIPGKTLSDLSKILPGNTEEEVIIYFSDNNILFTFDNTTVVSRLVEGEYFRISQMITTDYETRIVINKKDFMDCLDRSLLLVRESEKKPLILDIRDGGMEISMNSTIGSMCEQLDAEKEGPDLMIGFNPRFLMDALRAIDDETVSLYMINSKSPCFIRDSENTYVYLILPVNFSSARG